MRIQIWKVGIQKSEKGLDVSQDQLDVLCIDNNVNISGNLFLSSILFSESWILM